MIKPIDSLTPEGRRVTEKLKKFVQNNSQSGVVPHLETALVNPGLTYRITLKKTGAVQHEDYYDAMVSVREELEKLVEFGKRGVPPSFIQSSDDYQSIVFVTMIPAKDLETRLDKALAEEREK